MLLRFLHVSFMSQQFCLLLFYYYLFIAQFLIEHYSIVWTYRNLFICSAINEHLSYFQSWVMIIKASVDNCVRMFLWVFLSFAVFWGMAFHVRATYSCLTHFQKWGVCERLPLLKRWQILSLGLTMPTLGCMPFPQRYSRLWIISPNSHRSLTCSIFVRVSQGPDHNPIFLSFIPSSIFYSSPVNGGKAVNPPSGLTRDLMVWGETPGISSGPCMRQRSSEKQNQ